MRRFFRSRWFKIPFFTLVFGFAAIGFFLTVSYLAIQYGWTRDGGSVDVNTRYFQSMSDKYNQAYKVDSASIVRNKYEALDRILILNKYYPKNAEYIMNALQKGSDEITVLKMLDAADLQLKGNKYYQKEIAKSKFEREHSRQNSTSLSVYEWMNISEWQDFKIAVAKDKKLIDSVAKVTGIEARTFVSCLVAEQIRLFNSKREIYKSYIGPLKVLSVESKFSYGVTGIKEHTAKIIETNAKNPSSIYYTGIQDENLLNFIGADTATINAERISRLTNYHNHYYSYLYAALLIKQMKKQWAGAGFPIEGRPEISATLFNLGFINSKPKNNPQVGGAEILIHEKPYTFGAIAFQFYYSGELINLFPYERKKA